MNIINNKTVSVATSSELKEVLENNNGYEYIYLESGITINSKKSKVIINGTYQNITHTLTGMNSSSDSDTIVATALTKEVQVKNIKIINPNINGIIYVPEVDSYDEIVTIYDNITFNGVQLSFNPYGVVKISNSVITIENTNGIECQEVSEAERVIIGGKTNISSDSTNFSLFAFRSDSINPSLVFLCKSDIIVATYIPISLYPHFILM